VSRTQRYWDSNCFLGCLKGEEDKIQSCRGVIQAAEQGRILIVTSAWTLIEVVKLKQQLPIPEADAAKVEEFFMHEFIRPRNVDRFLAERARELIWRYGFLKPKDAIHIATAVDHHITIFDTFDQELWKLNGEVGNPPMRIGKPDIAYQQEIFSQTEEVSRPSLHQILFRQFGKLT
jgi:predicted nucleic acid-binding protein